MTLKLKRIKYMGVERTTREWESILDVTQNQMQNIKAKHGGWIGAIEWLLSDESKDYGKCRNAIIKFRGQEKHRDLWAKDFGVSVNSIIYRRDQLGSYVKALEFFANQRSESEKERAGFIISADILFYMTMKALTPRGLTCNERVM